MPANKCPIHGIPDCSPLLNGCNLPARLAEAESLRAELAAANARCAELEKEYEARTITSVHRARERDTLQARCAELEVERDHWKKRADDEYQSGGKAFRELVTTIKETEEAWTEETDALTAERDALQATLDRVTALADEWEAAEVGVPSPDTALSGNECAADLRAALTPEGKP